MNNHFNPLDMVPKQLISDSLEGILSTDEVEEQIDHLFIAAAIILDPRENSIMGNLVGVEFSSGTKIDLKISLHDAFNFISNVLIDEQSRKIESVILTHDKKIVNVSGPFTVSNAKIIEIDSTNRMCVLAIDLIKKDS